MVISTVLAHLTYWLLALCVVFIVALWARNHKIWLAIMKLPGPRLHPIYGNLKAILSLYMRSGNISPHVYLFQFICGTSHIYCKEKVYRIWRMWYPLVVFHTAEGFEVILNSSTSLEKSRDYDLIHGWLGTGLITSGGDKWKTRRKMITPAFHFRILEDFVPIINEQSFTLVNLLAGSAGTGHAVDIYPLAVRCTLDIICESAMGVTIDAQRNTDSIYLQAVQNFSELFPSRNLRPWLWNDFIYSLTPSGRKMKQTLKTLHGFTRQVIRERKSARLEQQKTGDIPTTADDDELVGSYRKRRAFLDLLLDYHINDKVLTEEGIREEVDTFMFAGHDTTSVGISWALYCIGLYPDVQERLHDELDAVFAGDVERHVTSEDVKQMKYLDCVLKESQRVYPSVPFIGRILNEDVNIGGYHIHKGVSCFLFTYMLHRNAEAFPEPEKFKPERFLPENSASRHLFAYVPFSAGPRNCMGQRFAVIEEKIVIANILRNYSVKSLDSRDKVHVVSEIVLRPKGELRLQFKKRT